MRARSIGYIHYGLIGAAIVNHGDSESSAERAGAATQRLQECAVDKGFVVTTQAPFHWCSYWRNTRTCAWRSAAHMTCLFTHINMCLVVVIMVFTAVHACMHECECIGLSELLGPQARLLLLQPQAVPSCTLAPNNS